MCSCWCSETVLLLDKQMNSALENIYQQSSEPISISDSFLAPTN